MLNLFVILLLIGLIIHISAKIWNPAKVIVKTVDKQIIHRIIRFENNTIGIVRKVSHKLIIIKNKTYNLLYNNFIYNPFKYFYEKLIKRLKIIIQPYIKKLLIRFKIPLQLFLIPFYFFKNIINLIFNFYNNFIIKLTNNNSNIYKYILLSFTTFYWIYSDNMNHSFIINIYNNNNILYFIYNYSFIILYY